MSLALFTTPRGVCPVRWAEMSADAKRRILGLRPVLGTVAPAAARGLAWASGGPALSAEDDAVVAAVRKLASQGLRVTVRGVALEAFGIAHSKLLNRLREQLLRLDREGPLVLTFDGGGRIWDMRCKR